MECIECILHTMPNCTQKAWKKVCLHRQNRADPLHDLSAPHTLVAVLVVERTYPFKQICVAMAPASLGVVAGL